MGNRLSIVDRPYSDNPGGAPGSLLKNSAYRNLNTGEKRFFSKFTRVAMRSLLFLLLAGSKTAIFNGLTEHDAVGTHLEPALPLWENMVDFFVSFSGLGGGGNEEVMPKSPMSTSGYLTTFANATTSLQLNMMLETLGSPRLKDFLAELHEQGRISTDDTVTFATVASCSGVIASVFTRPDFIEFLQSERRRVKLENGGWLSDAEVAKFRANLVTHKASLAMNSARYTLEPLKDFLSPDNMTALFAIVMNGTVMVANEGVDTSSFLVRHIYGFDTSKRVLLNIGPEELKTRATAEQQAAKESFKSAAADLLQQCAFNQPRATETLMEILDMFACGGQNKCESGGIDWAKKKPGDFSILDIARTVNTENPPTPLHLYLKFARLNVGMILLTLRDLSAQFTFGKSDFKSVRINLATPIENMSMKQEIDLAVSLRDNMMRMWQLFGDELAAARFGLEAALDTVSANAGVGRKAAAFAKWRAWRGFGYAPQAEPKGKYPPPLSSFDISAVPPNSEERKIWDFFKIGNHIASCIDRLTDYITALTGDNRDGADSDTRLTFALVLLWELCMNMIALVAPMRGSAEKAANYKQTGLFREKRSNKRYTCGVVSAGFLFVSALDQSPYTYMAIEFFSASVGAFLAVSKAVASPLETAKAVASEGAEKAAETTKAAVEKARNNVLAIATVAAVGVSAGAATALKQVVVAASPYVGPALGKLALFGQFIFDRAPKAASAANAAANAVSGVSADHVANLISLFSALQNAFGADVALSVCTILFRCAIAYSNFELHSGNFVLAGSIAIEASFLFLCSLARDVMGLSGINNEDFVEDMLDIAREDALVSVFAASLAPIYIPGQDSTLNSSLYLTVVATSAFAVRRAVRALPRSTSELKEVLRGIDEVLRMAIPQKKLMVRDVVSMLSPEYARLAMIDERPVSAIAANMDTERVRAAAASRWGRHRHTILSAFYLGWNDACIPGGGYVSSDKVRWAWRLVAIALQSPTATRPPSSTETGLEVETEGQARARGFATEAAFALQDTTWNTGVCFLIALTIIACGDRNVEGALFRFKEKTYAVGFGAQSSMVLGGAVLADRLAEKGIGWLATYIPYYIGELQNAAARDQSTGASLLTGDEILGNCVPVTDESMNLLMQVVPQTLGFAPKDGHTFSFTPVFGPQPRSMQ
jgi:hypothetical protein